MNPNEPITLDKGDLEIQDLSRHEETMHLQHKSDVIKMYF